jgi:hypothetical protein
MALQRGPGSVSEHGHICRIPRPLDLEVPQGHVCECGTRWSYQPAHWEVQVTLDELLRRQHAAAFLRDIIPSFRPEPRTPKETGIIVPIGRRPTRSSSRGGRSLP